MLDYDKLTAYSTLRRESMISEIERTRAVAERNTWTDPFSKRIRNHLGELLISMGTRLKDSTSPSFEQLELAHQ
jgi:hypothetical protein